MNLSLRQHLKAMNYGPVIAGKVLKTDNLTELNFPGKDELVLILSDEESPWESEVYLPAEDEISEAESERISGNFLIGVFELENCVERTWNFAHGMKHFVASKGEHIKQLIFFYTYCKNCAGFYGKNYIVFFAKI